MSPDGPVVEVVAHDPAWAGQFEATRDRLRHLLPETATIEHIGSTSIGGLAAKPIIDVMLVIEPLVGVDALLGPLRYFLIERYFADDPDHLCLDRDLHRRRIENLHAFSPRSPIPQQNRDFRDYLRVHPAERAAYAEIKLVAARRHPHSRADYSRAKAAATEELVRRAQVWARTGAEELAASATSPPPH